MTAIFEDVFAKVNGWAEEYAITVVKKSLKAEIAGTYDGKSVTINSIYSPEESTYYLAHALGSIVIWSIRKSAVQKLFTELRNAKHDKSADPSRLERAIAAYQAFETESSEFAVWMLTNLGAEDLISSYSNFMQADLVALTICHREGEAPVWRDFFARWNQEMACGHIKTQPFHSKPIPSFEPKRIEKQEILQKQPD